MFGPISVALWAKSHENSQIKPSHFVSFSAVSHIHSDALRYRGSRPGPHPEKGVNMPELMTVGDFLSRYAISRTEFYRQVHRGCIRLTKLGSASRVARADAEAWLASLPVKQGSDAHE